jgi:hypothetical protein
MKQMQHNFASLPGMTIPLIVKQIVTEQRVANACMDPTRFRQQMRADCMDPLVVSVMFAPSVTKRREA